MWRSELVCVCAVIGLLLCVSILVRAEHEESPSRIRRQTSGSHFVSYECLTHNNIRGSCVHFSECPEHSDKTLEQLSLHRCFTYRKPDRPPIVCCANPLSSTSPKTSSATANSLSGSARVQFSGGRPKSGPQLNGASQQSSTQISGESPNPQVVGARPQVVGVVPVPTMTSTGPRSRSQPDSDDLLNHPNARLLPTESCGRHSTGCTMTGRTYGGNTTQLGGFPWTVLLKYRKGNKEMFLCGGVLIGDRYVLTAAHCVFIGGATLVAARIGDHDHTTDPDCENSEGNTERLCAPPVLDIPVMRAITPVQYDKSNINHYYDIAVLILRNTTPFNDYVQPVCLPFGEMGNRDLTNRRLWIAGWATRMGKEISVKIAKDVSVINPADCAAQYQGGQISISRDKQICTSDRDSCKSDSGGPLMSFRGTPRGDVWYLHGIESFGPTPCTTAGMPEVYTRVSYYLGWILTSLSTGS